MKLSLEEEAKILVEPGFILVLSRTILVKSGNILAILRKTLVKWVASQSEFVARGA